MARPIVTLSTNNALQIVLRITFLSKPEIFPLFALCIEKSKKKG